MDPESLIRDLSRPGAYPFECASIEVHQTHISVVFLAGEFAYKIKKPVNLGFLDFSTLEKRRHFCDEEVRLNRRLAPSVYLGVVPVSLENGQARLEGHGEPTEWAVKMVRLPAEATLEQRLARGVLTAEKIACLARMVAEFHAKATTSPAIASFGRFEVVQRNAEENFQQSRHDIGRTVHPEVFERLRLLSSATLKRLRPLIESRAERGVPRDTHGDLHLDHVYLFPDRPPPDDLQIIDCIEFNDRFRYADPVADMAFLYMDLKFHGRGDLADSFANAYFRAAGDEEGRALLSFYTAYRAIVRAKVEGIELREREIDATERNAALARAKAHWLLALGELEEPRRKPCLILVGGLPGTGKSTLARGLAGSANFTVIRSDVVRQEIDTAGADRYSPQQIDRTYRECLRRAEEAIFAGQRIIIDATFGREKWRAEFFDLARRYAIPALLFVCRADVETIGQRLGQRVGDASEADWNVYQQAAAAWEPTAAATTMHEIDARRSVEEVVRLAREQLHDAGLD
jgi:aminoglycoside phosphotransferase family enzyme/predicted kinase